MDNLFPILFIAVFVIIAIRQDRKNKRQQIKRLEEMQREMDEQAQEPSQDPAQRQTAPQRSTMLTPEQIAEKYTEFLRRHNEQLTEIQRRQAVQMNGEKNVEMPEMQGRALTSARSSSKSVGSSQRNSKTAKKVKTPISPQADIENTTTSASRASADGVFDFDIERAVVEAEILKPKYLDY